MTATARARRWVQGGAGAALLALGVTGLVGTWQGVASAQPEDRGRNHETMDQMMDAMHGEGTAARMHQVAGGEQMMDQCASMMAMMGDMNMPSMDEMMRDGGMMDGMRPGRGASGTGGTVGGMMSR